MNKCRYCLLHNLIHCDNHNQLEQASKMFSDVIHDEESVKWIEGILFNLYIEGKHINHSIVKNEFAKTLIDNRIEVTTVEVQKAVDELDKLTEKDFYNFFKKIKLQPLKTRKIWDKGYIKDKKR